MYEYGLPATFFHSIVGNVARDDECRYQRITSRVEY